MTFGYLLVVSKNTDVDYLKLAYALALTIKNTQKEGYDKVALVIDDKSRLDSIKSPWVFNEIIEWNRETFWNGRSWMDELSPWDYTVCLDADMLFTRDYSHWIDYLIENCELYIPSTAYTYRNEEIVSDFYRKTFTANDLPNLYSFFTFFKKDSVLAKDFFELGRFIIKNPTEFKNAFLSKRKPLVVGTDEAFSLSAKILDIADMISYPLDFPKVVHMKPMVQDWPWDSEKWTYQIGFYLNTHGELKIGNFQQTDVVHYVEKDLITDEVISILEEIVWNKSKSILTNG
jgi:hypothetical protein